MLGQTECGNAVRHTTAFRCNGRHSRPPGALCQSAISLNFPNFAQIRAIFLPFLFAIAAATLLLAGSTGAKAQDGIMMKGDAVVTGFSGIKPADAPLPPGASPLDEFFIDLDGPSAQILSLAAPGNAPSGELISTPPALQVYARQVGQVFATALDDGLGAGVPNIYLGQTLAYGAHIVLPDNDGDGWPERLKTGAAGAQWMAGQFGSDPEGGPGAIYKVDGISGAVTLFATLPGNSGAGIGDIVFDAETRQFFVSDLDNGLVYRLSETGDVIDSFDHGVDGRPADGLAAVADDGETADIENATFDIEKPETWGFTQEERRVHGLAIREGRVFYAADGHVWSVAISADGFGEAQWELEAESAEAEGPITDILFDNDGRLYLARRGEQRGSYDFSVYAEPEKSDVVRYSLEDPDDPETKSRWVEDPEEYAIGMPEDHRQAEGGIALGYPYDESGFLRVGACGEMLWSTGHRLLPATPPAEGEEAQNDVHGLQGNAISLVRPENVPPSQSYFSDYDGFFGDAAKSGHVGDVEIWQPCEGVSQPDYGFLPPGVLPPGDIPPDLPPEFPPDYDYETNLKLTKRADPKKCWNWFGAWICEYRIRVTNTGPDHYFGPVLINDWLPDNPVGASMGFSPTPPWSCWNTAANAYSCFRPNVFLTPGASIGLSAYVVLPIGYDKCNLRNAAAIEWAPGGSQWNTDPTDDYDTANALIPSEECEDPDEESDLLIQKWSLHPCVMQNGMVRCVYDVSVQNVGPGEYNGDIVVDETIPAGTNATFLGAGWNCVGASPNYTCTFANASLQMGGGEKFTVVIELAPADAKQMNCRVPNQVAIASPLGHPSNTDPTNDTASADGTVPPEICEDTPPRSNLKIEKRVPLGEGMACEIGAGNDWCHRFEISVTNTGPGPFNGKIKVTDVVPLDLSMSFIGGPGWSCIGETCETDAAVTLDKNPPSGDEVHLSVVLEGTAEHARNMDCKLRNRARIDSPLGAPKNTNAADDQDEIMVDLDQRFCESNLKIEKKANPKLCEKQGGGWWCTYNIVVTNTGPSVYNHLIHLEEVLPAEPLDATWNAPWTCEGLGGGGGGAMCKHPVVEIPVNGKVTLKLRVKFAEDLVKEKLCRLANVVKIYRPFPGSPINNNPDDDIADDTAFVPEDICKPQPTACPPGFDWNGEACQRGGITTTPPVPPRPTTPEVEECPDGYRGTPPNCRWITQPDPEVCTGGRILRNGECVCRRGREWNGQRCVTPPQQCTGGRTLRNGECVCPRGREWNGQRCVRQVQCTGGRTLRNGECVCPRGREWNGQRCVRQVQCTGGRILRNGECVCRRGRVWNGSRCVRQVQCTGGRVLRNGECVCRRGRVWNGSRCVRAPVLRPTP